MRSSASSRTSNNSPPSSASKNAGDGAATGALERRSLRHETIFAGMVAALFSVLAFGYCFPRNMLLLYGDAVAHLGIARRLIDSLNPGIRQIGSVWLPFPHLLMMPFAARTVWWQNGIAGAIPSMACYILSVAGLWRLSRYWLRPAGAVVATLFFALNPGLLYMQTTAMNEPVFLCQMIWAALFLMAFLRGLGEGNPAPRRQSPVACGVVLVTAIYTRYDGWIFTCIVWLVALRGLWRAGAWRSPAGGAFVLFTAMLVFAPILWFAWNARQYGDWLDFMRGPYSAKAIDVRTSHSWRAPLSWLAQPSVAACITSNRRNWARSRPGGGFGCSSLPLPARSSPLLLCDGAIHASPPSCFLDAAPVLRLLRRLGIRPHLHPAVVAPLLVQHPLRHGNAAHLRRFLWASSSHG